MKTSLIFFILRAMSRLSLLLLLVLAHCADEPCKNCPNGSVCILEECYTPCNIQKDCPKGLFCGDNGVCQRGVPLNSSCGEGLRCQDGTSCVDGACLKNCTNRNQCYPLEYCDGNVCQSKRAVNATCAHDYECLFNICHNSLCMQECQAESDCEANQYCDFGNTPALCQDLLPFGSDCNTDTQCVDYLCEQGKCSRDCSQKACPTGSYCEQIAPEQLRCLPQLTFESLCSKDEQCRSGRCIPVLHEDGSTDEEQYCSNACTDLGDCELGYYCGSTPHDERLSCYQGCDPLYECCSSLDCSTDRVCTLGAVIHDGQTDILPRCAELNLNDNGFGQACSQQDPCASQLCFSDGRLSESYCTKVCQIGSNNDCPAPDFGCDRRLIPSLDLYVDLCVKN